jgi:hypothetical protein
MCVQMKQVNKSLNANFHSFIRPFIHLDVKEGEKIFMHFIAIARQISI